MWRRVPARVAWMEWGGERVVPWPLVGGGRLVWGGERREEMERGAPHPLGVVGNELAGGDD